MKALHRKLLRDLWRLRGQVFAIALVMASGIGVLVMSLTTVESLEETAIAYYERYDFAQVFAHVERAPEHLRDRLREIPGVRTVETRVVRTAVLDIEGFEEPVIGRLVSVPERHEPQLNRLALRQGRYPRLGAPDEAVLTEPFAQAHGLEVGRQAAGHHQQPLAGADGGRHRAVAGVRLRDRAGSADAGRPALRRAVDGTRGPAGRV